jgi:methionyl-tRNA formyltransferase
MINLHSGLSPYYRGTWSYGWPLVNNEPEYIGATVHHINRGLDTGDIIYQTRPVLDASDNLNTIFLKVISEGIELVCDAIENILKAGSVAAFSQPQNTGRLYLSKDFNAEAARSCISNLETGTITRYNANKQELDSRVHLYGYVPPRIFR